eukprot:m.66726 g.66726  ORF g.66726 m.66726 type:complete len:635 (-) comp12658_c0_seq1:141-2045(-)
MSPLRLLGGILLLSVLLNVFLLVRQLHDGKDDDLARKAHQVPVLKQRVVAKNPQTTKRPGFPGCRSNHMHLEVHSGSHVNGALVPCSVRLNGVLVIAPHECRRGLNIAVVNGRTGLLKETRNFDTFAESGQKFHQFIHQLTADDVLAVATHDDAFNSLGPRGRAALRLLGGTMIETLNYRGNLALVGRRGLWYSFAERVAPAVHSKDSWGWGPRVNASACVELGSPHLAETFQREAARMSFCRTKGSHPLCNFGQPLPSTLPLQPWQGPPERNVAAAIPIAIMASDRTEYLFKLIQSLHTQPGLNHRNVVVFIDGYQGQSAALAKVFGFRVVRFPKSNSTSTMEETFRNADKIALHYHRSLTALWDIFPRATEAIILEEDLTVSPDFLWYFSQTIPLLQQDKTLLTVSAWNDNAYAHSSSDPRRLYRTDFFPGLGWVLTRALWDELGPRWPPCCYGWSWDLWLRQPQIRGTRESIIPDVPRTFHAGKVGLNVNPHFFNLYFKNHALNNESNTVLRNMSEMLPENYHNDIVKTLTSAEQTHLTGNNESLCAAVEVPRHLSPTVAKVVRFYQAKEDDMSVLQKLCTCMKIWDLGVRGVFRGVLRLTLEGHQMLLVGSLSPYAAFVNGTIVGAPSTP